MKIDNYIANIPKAELHLHIEGTLEPELMFKLAKRNGVKLKFDSVAELRQAYDFNDLQSFLDIYYEGASVLITESDFFDLTYEYLLKMAEQNVKHVEIFFDPQTHTDRGVLFDTVINGISSALDKANVDLNISSEIIMCFLRHLSEEEAFKTLEQAIPFKNKIIAVGLDSSEQDHPPSKFSNVFKKCRDLGFKTVAHAGEEGPASYIWEAIRDLKVKRIDHGVNCDQDSELVDYLVKNKMPLTVCPLSNLRLKVYKNLKNHNLKNLLELGVLITINSDDPAYFGGYLNENYIQTKDALNLTRDDIKTLAINSFRASFLPQEKIDKYISEVNNG